MKTRTALVRASASIFLAAAILAAAQEPGEAKDSGKVGPLSIAHQGQFPAVTLTFNLQPGIALGQAVDAFSQASRLLPLSVSPWAVSPQVSRFMKARSLRRSSPRLSPPRAGEAAEAAKASGNRVIGKSARNRMGGSPGWPLRVPSVSLIFRLFRSEILSIHLYFGGTSHFQRDALETCLLERPGS